MSTQQTKEERQRAKEERQRASEQKKLSQSKLRGALESEENNPCLKEHKLANQCMSENHFNEDLCTIYFENYKACKTFWWSVQMDRRRRKIVPELPPLEERIKIKADYMKKMNAN